MRTAIDAKSATERASIAIALIKARRTSSRRFSDCFEMGDGDDVIREILRRASDDPVIEQRYPHVAHWRDTFERPYRFEHAHGGPLTAAQGPWRVTGPAIDPLTFQDRETAAVVARALNQAWEAK